jgi:type II secretion system protein N
LIVVENIFGPILYVLREKKKMIFLILILIPIFAIAIFPYDDLSDMITELIAQNSQNQVFIQFDDLGIGILPPSLKMSNVAVDTAVLPTVKAKKLFLAPNIAGLLAFSPGFSAAIEDVLKGDLQIDYRAGKKLPNEAREQNVKINVDRIDLKSLTTFAQAPVDLEGHLSATLDGVADPLFTDQPDGQLTITVDKFRLPPSTVPTMLGPVSLPNTEISKLTLVGELHGGNFDITESKIGDQTDGINGRLKGRLAVRLTRVGNQVVPEFGAYEIKIDLNFDRLAEKNYGLFLNLFDKFRTVTGTGSRYAFRLVGQNFMVPPNPSALGSW